MPCQICLNVSVFIVVISSILYIASIFCEINLEKVCLVLDYAALDEMGNRIDELEQSINDLRTEMGQEGSPSPSATLKSKDEPKSAEDST